MKNVNTTQQDTLSTSAEIIPLKRILVVDDDVDFAESILDILDDKGYRTKSAYTILEGLRHVADFRPHIAILDIRIGNENGVSLISKFRELNPTTLCIMLTGYADTGSAISALREDAFDYLTKPIHPDELLSKIKRGFDKLEIEKHHFKITQALQSSEERYRTILENMVDGVVTLESNGEILSFNHAAEVIFGFTAKEAIGKNIALLVDLVDELSEENLNQYISTFSSTAKSYEISARHKSGKSFPLRFLISKLPNNDVSVEQYILSCFDITIQKEQEHQLRQTQKLDSLGKLTGGITHDYNNLLSIISGYAEQMIEQLDDESKISHYARTIKHAATRGAKLTDKLLRFSHHNSSDEKSVDLNSLLLGQKTLLEKTLTAQISLTINLGDAIFPIWVDENELEDVLLNLSINAMHAMEHRGHLTLSTSNLTLTDMDAPYSNISSGDYVLLSITDTGCGMSEDVKDKIFDPFFTTKGDHGTGLGLSQVFKFVERSKGMIKVYSEPGQGSKFTLYFPRCKNSKKVQKELSKPLNIDLRGSESILVVDDESGICELIQEIFTNQGYQVNVVNNAIAALRFLEKNKIDLVVSDVIMPGMNGYQLSKKIQESYPNIIVQMISGFSDDRHLNKLDRRLHKNMLYKPFSSHVLLRKVRERLNEKNVQDSLEGRRILVVDDEEGARDLFRINLEKLGCCTFSAQSAREAIELFKDTSMGIDVIIMDLNIPGDIGGVAIAKAIKANDPRAKIIVSSGHSESSEMTNFSAHGFHAKLEKTFDRDAIKKVLEEVLSLDTA